MQIPRAAEEMLDRLMDRKGTLDTKVRRRKDILGFIESTRIPPEQYMAAFQQMLDLGGSYAASLEDFRSALNAQSDKGSRIDMTQSLTYDCMTGEWQGCLAAVPSVKRQAICERVYHWYGRGRPSFGQRRFIEALCPGWRPQ